MPESRKLKDYKCVLLVEGHSDLVFFAECLERLDKHAITFIQMFNGKEDLIAKLEVFINPQLLAEKRAIGIIVDANAKPAATFQSIQAAIAKLANQTVPSAGVWTAGPPKIGVFVAPDNVNNGEIETLVWKSWCGEAKNSSYVACITNYLACMREAGMTEQSPDKARVGALLAIANDDDPRLGPGARAHVFDFGRPEFSDLLKFLGEF